MLRKPHEAVACRGVQPSLSPRFTSAWCSTRNSTISRLSSIHAYTREQYSTVQYGTLQYSIVRYVTVQCSTVRYSTVQYGTSQYSTVGIRNSTVQDSAILYRTVRTLRYNRQNSTVQYSQLWLGVPKVFGRRPIVFYFAHKHGIIFCRL